jgi:hypothetical protein
MPHFGLMDADALGPEKAALQRARLHIRAGKRRLRQQKISYGIITLADALTHAMQWHLESPALRKKLIIREGEDLTDDGTAYAILVHSGVLDGSFDFDAFDRLVEEALEFRLEDFDYKETLRGIESVMARLGVMPFDESKLPPEDPCTY